jgi:carbon monoxide dehydrogenase subunit G
MARYVIHIRSPWPPVEAFDYMADLENFAQWDVGVVSAEQVAGDEPGVGTEFDVAVKSIGGTLTLRYRTVSYESPRQVVARAQSRMLTSLDTITVEPDGDGSIVTYDAELTLNSLLRLGDPILGLAFNRIGDRAVAGLIDVLDGERVPTA